VPNRQELRPPSLAKYINVAELQKRLRSQEGPLRQLHPPLAAALKRIDDDATSSLAAKHVEIVELRLRSASAAAVIIYRTCVRLLAKPRMNNLAFRRAVSEEEITPYFDKFEEKLTQEIHLRTRGPNCGAERVHLLEIARDGLRAIRDGAAWDQPDVPQTEHSEKVLAPGVPQGPREMSPGARFDRIAGQLMSEAHLELLKGARPRHETYVPRLPFETFIQVVEKVDQSEPRFRLKEVLPKSLSKRIAEHNQKLGKKSGKIETFAAAVSNKRFRRETHYRFNRAEINYRKHPFVQKQS